MLLEDYFDFLNKFEANPKLQPEEFCDFRCSRSMLLSRVQIVTMREIYARIGFGQRCVESIGNMIKGRALYKNVILELLNLFWAKCAQSTTLITCSQTPYLTSQCM